MTNRAIPDEAVEAAARAGYTEIQSLMGFPSSYDSAPKGTREAYALFARAALQAAAPIMLSHERESDPTPYKLPEPVVLPDLADEAVAREYRKRAEKCARETQRTRRHYWLHQLFPWL